MQEPLADPKPSLRRKAAFYALTILLVYGVLEGISLIAYVIVGEDSFSFPALQDRRLQVMSTPAERVRLDTTARALPPAIAEGALHPYVGFVLNPAAAPPNLAPNAYGFYGPAPPVDRREDDADTIFVAVLGGSVAAGLVRVAGETLRRELQRVKPFAGKEVSIISLGLGGFKQPQQLMILNYFMSMGARFDLVINLDGFNEIVLPVAENARGGTNPFYPRGWKMRLAGITDQDLLREAGRLTYLESLRHDAARFFSRAPMKYSVTANLFWDRLDLGLWSHIAHKRAALTQALLDRQDNRQAVTFAETGPPRTYASDEARYADLAAFWKRCSMMMNTLAQSSGSPYFHFLQPNQYVQDSKIFTEEERVLAFKEGHPYAKAARPGYPYLIEAGKDLPHEGVNYTDLTLLFTGNDEILYQDICCNFNQRGYTLIALEIGRVIREKLGRAE